MSTGYVVANVIILPVSGWLSGFVGRRNYFVISILVFTLSSVACGNATTLGGLVFWRIIQGLAGGGLISTAQAALFESFPPKEAHTAMAIFGLGVMVGPMLGPTLGGWITDNWSWPWIFYINLPMGARTAASTRRTTCAKSSPMPLSVCLRWSCSSGRNCGTNIRSSICAFCTTSSSPPRFPLAFC